MTSDSPSRPIALVTGATAGIGAAFARQLAATGHDVILVARDRDRLDAYATQLRDAHGGRVDVASADLSTMDGCEEVEARLRSTTDVPIDLLVNSAGYSLNRSFTRSTVDDEERLLRLNVTAVMRLTHAVLPSLLERRRGGVINVSSVTGFAAVMPGSTYPAGKAWVTNFSESIGLATRPLGVHVMALCPGYTRTEFHQRAGIDTTKTPGWMWLDADDVVRAALRDFARGKFVSVPDWRYKTTVFGIRHLPWVLSRRVAAGTRKRTGRETSIDVSPEKAGNLSD